MQLRSGLDLRVDQARFLLQRCCPTVEILRCYLSAVAHRQTVGQPRLAHQTGSRRRHHRIDPGVNLRCSGLAVAGWTPVLAAPAVAFALVVAG